jgi:hypothetical protein
MVDLDMVKLNDVRFKNHIVNTFNDCRILPKKY